MIQVIFCAAISCFTMISVATASEKPAKHATSFEARPLTIKQIERFANSPSKSLFKALKSCKARADLSCARGYGNEMEKVWILEVCQQADSVQPGLYIGTKTGFQRHPWFDKTHFDWA